ncbi:hypothetical protein AB0H18_46080, partial [Streptomyces sp. NPDC020766]|uniref:hypothetical protein n=1 Tax=Streptomyces sp. NPDC020766 TaxID=3155011 RepID=UPI0033DCC372
LRTGRGTPPARHARTGPAERFGGPFDVHAAYACVGQGGGGRRRRRPPSYDPGGDPAAEPDEREDPSRHFRACGEWGAPVNGRGLAPP